jgi:cytochrome c556
MSPTDPRPTTGRAALFLLAGLCALTAGAVCASTADNASSPQTVIETRRATFKKMGAAMKAIVEQLKSDAPDSARMVAAAQVISAGAEELPRWFPAGTGPEAGVETDALPYIWQERAKFDSLVNRLLPESKTMVAAISGKDLAAIKAQVKAVSEVCSTCHHSFRAD